MAVDKDQGADVNPVVRELQRLWLRAGRPSSRRIALYTGGVLSHTHINLVLRGGQELIRWPTVEAIAVALDPDADVDRLRTLWLALPVPPPRPVKTGSRGVRETSPRVLAAALDRNTAAMEALTAATDRLTAAIERGGAGEG